MTKKNHTAHPNKGRVILTYGRSLMALTAAHSLGNRGIDVIGCDDVDMTVLRFSNHVSENFVHAPYEDDIEQYLDDMEENIRKFKPEDDRPYILMPMFRDAKILAKHRARFEGLITIAAPDFETINRVNPKDVFASTCEELSLSIPETHQTKNLAELEAIKDNLKFPILIKPIDAVGGKGIHKAKDWAELKALYEESIEHFDSPPLVQELLGGEDYCLCALCENGEIAAHMAYKNLYQFPRGSGAGIMRETIDDAPFMKDAQKLLGALKWNGIAQIDFRWSGRAEDKPYLIEVNPRFWAGLFHSVESGVDFPWLLYQLAAYGKVIDHDHAKIGVKTKVPGLWTISALQEIAQNETNFEALKQTWHEIWDAQNDESWREKFSDFAEALKHSIDGKGMIDELKEMKLLGKNAKSEFAAKDDPLTGLGVLFIASSLLRHKELPPEVKM